MRALFWVAGLLAALWSGYWVAGSRGVETATKNWFAQAQDQGLIATNEGIVVQGFPNRFDLTVSGLTLADPAQGIGWRTEFVQVFAMTWKPWHLIAALAPAQTITLPDQSLTLQSSRLMGSLRMVPGSDLALNDAVIEGEGLQLASTTGWVLGAEKAVASIQSDPSRLDTYRLGLSTNSFSPDPALVAATGLAAVISDIHLDAHIGLSAPIDRQLPQTHPRLTALDLGEFRLIWGDLKIFAKGGFTPDANGLAQGEITFRVENWQALPGVLAAMGAIDPAMAPTIKTGLEIMANSGADPAVLVLPLIAKDGRMALGPFPLGAAPAF